MLSIQKYKKYFPECYKHGTLDQIWSQAAYKWLCKHGSCKSEAFGLTHEMFIQMMSDSKKYEINETDREEIAKQLSYFPSILKSEISHILNNNGPPVIWKYDQQKATFVEDTTFVFDDSPLHHKPLNYLPRESIVVPRMRCIFYTNEKRYGIKLELDKDIRIIRPGHVAKVYANTVYLTPSPSKRSSESAFSSSASEKSKRRRTNTQPHTQPQSE